MWLCKRLAQLTPHQGAVQLLFSGGSPGVCTPADESYKDETALKTLTIPRWLLCHMSVCAYCFDFFKPTHISF